MSHCHGDFNSLYNLITSLRLFNTIYRFGIIGKLCLWHSIHIYLLIGSIFATLLRVFVGKLFTKIIFCTLWTMFGRFNKIVCIWGFRLIVAVQQRTINWKLMKLDFFISRGLSMFPNRHFKSSWYFHSVFHFTISVAVFFLLKLSRLAMKSIILLRKVNSEAF